MPRGNASEQFAFQINPEKQLSTNTVRAYRGKLNQITKLSLFEHSRDAAKPVIKTRDDLLNYSDHVVALLQDHIAPDKRLILCAMYSAIFYAIGRQDFDQDSRGKIYANEFRKAYYSDEYKEKLRAEGKLVD